MDFDISKNIEKQRVYICWEIKIIVIVRFFMKTIIEIECRIVNVRKFNRKQMKGTQYRKRPWDRFNEFMQSGYKPRGCTNRPFRASGWGKRRIVEKREENQDLIKCSLLMAHTRAHIHTVASLLLRIPESNNPSISLARAAARPPPTVSPIIQNVLQQYAELHAKRNRFVRIVPEMSFHVINKLTRVCDVARINKTREQRETTKFVNVIAR